MVKVRRAWRAAADGVAKSQTWQLNNRARKSLTADALNGSMGREGEGREGRRREGEGVGSFCCRLSLIS